MNTYKKWYKILFEEGSRNNLMYGQFQVLRSYTEVKLPYQIPGPLTHGWHSGCGIHGKIVDHGVQEKRKKYFVWNERNLEKCRKYGYANVTAIGAPFLYLPPLLQSTSNSNNSRSLLLFAEHSNEIEPFIDPLKVYKRYLKEIEEILPLFENFTICLYWFEYQNKAIIDLFKNRQIPVITLGHRDNNAHFLLDFRNLVNQYSHVSSTRMCTAILYSLYMRKKTFIFGTPATQKTRNNIKWPNRDFYQRDIYFNLYPELFWENFDDRSHFQIGEKELGFEFKRSPGELRELFEWTPSRFFRQLLGRVRSHASHDIKRSYNAIKHRVKRKIYE